METTKRRRQGISDTLIITRNSISASEAKEVGFNDMMNNFGPGRGRCRRIVISRNDIISNKGLFVGIRNLFNNHRNLSAVVIFLLVVVALILLGWATRRTTLLTQGEMSRLTILINYDGRWVNSTYENCKTKGVLISDKITMEELRKKVYNIVNVDPIEYEITMKVIYEAMKTAWPAEIADDDDVRAFIFESLSSSYKIPLCITLKGKISNQQAPSVDVGQESMPVDLNVSTQLVLEDNHDSENDLGYKEFKDSESEVENNRTQLNKLLCENMQCEDIAYVEADNIFQDNAEFNELCGDNMGYNDVPAISVQFDEPNSDKPNSLEYSRMKILQKGFYDFQGEAAKMDSHVIEWADKLVQENNTKMLSLQFKEFVLNQPEAYEIKIGDQVFRRLGDPPLEEVVEKLQNEKKRVENESPAESNTHLNEEL